MGPEAEDLKDVAITAENFGGLRVEGAGLREIPARRDEAFALIRKLREFAIANKMHDDAVNLFWEDTLLYQHVVREQQDGPADQRDQKKIDDALAGMETANQGAQDYITANLLQHWQSRADRFAGKLADYRGKFPIARHYYEQALARLEDSPDYQQNPAVRHELEGFLAHAMILSGDPEAGEALAERTWTGLVESDEGRNLREGNYYTWAVWRSGVAIGEVGAFLDAGVDFDKQKMAARLEEAESLLKMPEGSSTQADPNFTIRKNEIVALKNKLGA